MVAVEILGGILEFTVNSFVRFFENLGASRFCSLEMRFNILDKYGEALSSGAELRRGRSTWFWPMDHNPGIAEMHLRAACRSRRVAIAVVFGEAKRFA